MDNGDWQGCGNGLRTPADRVYEKTLMGLLPVVDFIGKWSNAIILLVHRIVVKVLT